MSDNDKLTKNMRSSRDERLPAVSTHMATTLPTNERVAVSEYNTTRSTCQPGSSSSRSANVRLLVSTIWLCSSLSNRLSVITDEIFDSSSEVIQIRMGFWFFPHSTQIHKYFSVLCPKIVIQQFCLNNFCNCFRFFSQLSVYNDCKQQIWFQILLQHHHNIIMNQILLQTYGSSSNFLVLKISWNITR